MPTVVNMDSYAQAVRKTLTIRSLSSLVRLLRLQASEPDRVPSAPIATEKPSEASWPEKRGPASGPPMLQADPFRHKRSLSLLECRL